jgi:hypothetical protein
VSPRPAPRRDDATAMKFLHAGVQLLEAALSDGSRPLPPRLRSIKFPAALDWLRIEDVLRVVEADEIEVDGKRALRNRWPSKDEYVRDVVMYSLLYADSDGIAAPATFGARLTMLVDGRPFSEQVNDFAVGLVAELVANPRSYLLAHLSPMLTTHPALRADFIEWTRADHDVWRDFYEQLMRLFGLSWRPGWNSESFTLALQCLLDGFVLRHRVDEERSPLSEWAAPSFIGSTVTAIVVAAVDFDESGQSIGETLDALLAPKFYPAPTT